ncbi:MULTISPECIES: LysR substrate-binding domain-containing protein [Marinobacter]|jgi:DNA-binding transcriptional LysR family regulator|uniref:Transcriptional regulator, LysR family n=1 Tax=Marinobacter salarius TaxID=1420917 RepID=A0ABY1FKV0_9GAMM|nr:MULTISPECIES: LysR substrate-binding domain-containing protein [Marinobacter]KXJ46705.1 MAG: LysR family transcriptional regulator [Marinobacter sp. Hex_13]MBJ7298932.1 LysR family transcriptional regulator [Marinobacter salarius]MCC4283979.1 LysR family transcriptional regulator [Marinobacter salarius]MCZ4284379.1 LysR substrate-binding domain-containing protein [Marinobacter salarius]MDM8182004.1 LysR substrate-binding domain-containing protein [Marinobacter salarius]
MQRWEGVNEFVAVAETESFTRAAKRLDVSTAHVSRQISALEDRLSTRLFYRTTRRVSTTEAGQIYYQHCRQILDALEQAERSMTNMQLVPQGRLRLTAPVTYGEKSIAPLVNDFVLRYPELDVEMKLTNQQLDLVAEGYDLAVRLGKLDDSSLMARRLASRTLYVCASPAYLAVHGTPHSLSELEHHNCLQGNLGYWRFQDAGHPRNVRIRGNVRCDSGRALLDAALKGVGIVQLPDYYVGPALDAGTLIPLLTHYQEDDDGIWAVYPHNRHLSPKVRMLLDYFVDSLGVPNA